MKERNPFFNADEFKTAWAIMFEPDQVVEIRIIGNGKNDIRSGYFRDPDKAAAKLEDLAGTLSGCNVYWTINVPHEGCYSRLQRDCFMRNVLSTSDKDITRRRWLPIDIDVCRPAGCSSSHDEVLKAIELSRDITRVLDQIEMPKCLQQMSGNGIHILVPIEYDNTREAEQAVKGFLKSLDEGYSNKHAHIDTTTSNAARVLKVPGTVACKGRNTTERPWRMAYIAPAYKDYIRPKKGVSNL